MGASCLPQAGKKEKPDKKWYIFSALAASVGIILPVALLQAGISHLGAFFIHNSVVKDIFNAFITAALIEEFIKFLVGYIFVKYSKAQRKIDYIFIFAAAGIGFEVIESLLLASGNIMFSIVRGVLCVHVFWQMYQGACYYEYKKEKQEKGKSAQLIKAFVITIILHGLNDTGSFVALEGVDPVTEKLVDENIFFAGMAVLIISAIMNIVFMAITRHIAKREAIASREREIEAEKAENAEEAEISEETEATEAAEELTTLTEETEEAITVTQSSEAEQTE